MPRFVILRKASPTPCIPWRGLRLFIEVPAGGERCGVAPDGTPWTKTLEHAYGYACDSVGADGEEFDVYLGPDLDTADTVYLVHQQHPDGTYDEDKAMVGFPDRESAARAFVTDGPGIRHLGSISDISADEFARQVTEGALARRHLARLVGSLPALNT